MWRNLKTSEMSREQPRTVSTKSGITHNPDAKTLYAAGWYPVVLATAVSIDKVLRGYEYVFDDEKLHFNQVAITVDKATDDAEKEAALAAELAAENNRVAQLPVIQDVVARLVTLESKDAEVRI